jgi:hypothetical protein
VRILNQTESKASKVFGKDVGQKRASRDKNSCPIDDAPVQTSTVESEKGT